MKKMKKALFAVIAAFSLSACDFDIASLPSQVADTVGGWADSVKNLIPGAKKEEEKKEEDLPCDHKDANHDGVCDLCGASGLDVKHSDENKDHKCDVCGKTLSEHSDENKDHKCDYCGEIISQHTDENKDHICDYCGEKASDHVDANGDFICDICEAKLCEHKDENHDHMCDVCGEKVSEHVDANNDHVCDECEKPFTEHKDDDHNHLCDICSVKLSEHVDADNDFKCDYCSAELALASTELDLAEVKLTYALGDEFSAEGVKVIGTSEAGSKKELEVLSISAPDMTTAGEKEVVVTYGEGENDKLTYKISVLYWSEMDLQVFKAASLTSYAPLPYVLGHDMRVSYELDDEGYLTSWKILADNMDEDSFLDYVELLRAYGATVPTGNFKVEFKLNEISGDFEGYHDLEEVQLFSLVPSFLNTDDGYYYRAFNVDEYFVVGLNKKGQMQIESRMINSMLDGYFLGDGIADGSIDAALPSYYTNPKTGVTEYIPDSIGDPIYNYFSEYSYSKFLVPQLANTDSYFFIYNFATNDPLEEYFDQFDLAWSFMFVRVAEEEYNEYLGALLDAGFVKTSYDEYDSYLFEGDAYTGTLEFIPSFRTVEDEKEGTIGILDLDFYYYNAPTEYVMHLTPEIWAVEEAFVPFYDKDYSDYEDYGYVLCYQYLSEAAVVENFEDIETFVEYYARTLMAAGYTVVSGFEYDDWYSQYTFTVSNGVAGFEFWFDEEAEDGYFYFEAYAYDDTPESLVLPKAELELQAAFAASEGYAALNGIDYYENEDGSFWTYFFAEEAESVQEAAESVLSLLPESAKLSSSEAGKEEGVWVAVFDDVENGVQITVEAELDADYGYVAFATFANHRYTTPMTVITDFIIAESGAEPAEGAIVELEDGSLKYSSTVEGEFESLEAVAEEFAKNLLEGFEKTSSEAGISEDPTWVQVYEFEELKIKATIVVWGEEEGYSAYVRFEYIYPEFPLAGIEAFFTYWSAGSINVPGYKLSNVDAEIQSADYSSFGLPIYFVEISGSSHEEMVDYKDALLYAGWTITGTTEDGDYKLAYGSTGVTLSLVDYGDGVISLAFSYTAPAGEGMSPEEALKALGWWFDGVEPELDEDGDYAFSLLDYYSEDTGEDELDANPTEWMEYVDGIFALDDNLAAEFEAYYDEWQYNEEYEVYYMSYTNEANTVVTVQVYENYVYMLDGEVVDEDTEGAELTHVCCLYTYSYSY